MHADWGKIDSHWFSFYNSAARSKSPTVDGKDMAVNSRICRMVTYTPEIPRKQTIEAEKWEVSKMKFLFFAALLRGY